MSASEGVPAQPTPSMAVLARAEAQPVVFAARPSRAELYELPPLDADHAVAVRVHRNVAAERLLAPTVPFARYAGLDLSTRYEAYDDTLSFASLEGGEPDVELVWIDAGRLSGLAADDLATFFTSRLEALRAVSGAPILVLDVPGSDARAALVNAALAALADRLPALHVAALSQLAAELGDRFLSTRAADLTAVPLAPAALMRVAQELGLAWLPAAVGERIRAIAVDLDHTLYAGVLGEDGIDGVELTPAHRALQAALRAWHERGVFLAVLSKNEPDDVQALFAGRPDFPLQAGDIDAWGVGWGDKSVALAEVAGQLRIAPATFAFLDDNPGELVEVAGRHPGVRTLHAADPDLTARALDRFPGLFRFRDGDADALRTHDLAAAGEREQLRQRASDPAEYLAALGTTITFAIDRAEDVKRLAELAGKTNQFTTALARLDEVQLAERIADPHSRVIAIAVRDRLADAGTIGLVSARRIGPGDVVVEDVCVSCRALGRGLEQPMLGHALTRIATDLGAERLRLAVVDGPRNGPALRWLDELHGERHGEEVVIAVPAPPPDLPITITWEPS